MPKKLSHNYEESRNYELESQNDEILSKLWNKNYDIKSKNYDSKS